MNEKMPKTFDILKSRWMEVVFLLVLASLPQPMLKMLMSYNQGRFVSDVQINGYIIAIVMSVVLWTEGIASIFFRAGFLRTACVYGEQRQGLWTLIKTGAPFFLQFFILLFIKGFIMQAMMYPSQFAVSKYGHEVYQTYSWAWRLIPTVVSLALIKLYMFIPALIIVRKLNIITAFKALKHYRLFAAKEMLTLYAINLVLGIFGYRLIALVGRWPMAFAVSEYAMQLVLGLFSLAIMLSAVKFVAENTVDACGEAHPTDGLAE